MILVRVAALMGEDQVRRDARPEGFEYVLHLGAHERQEAVPVVLQKRSVRDGGPCEEGGGTLGLGGADANRAEHNPMKDAAGILCSQSKDRAAAADFNIVG